MLNVAVILKINKWIVLAESERLGVVLKVSKWAVILTLFFSTLGFLCVFVYQCLLDCRMLVIL